MYALRTNDGVEVWQYQIEELGMFNNSSPAVVGARVYIGSNDGNIYALNAVTGEDLWNFKADDEIESSPAVAEDVVYFGSSDGYVYALDARDDAENRVLWIFPTTR